LSDTGVRRLSPGYTTRLKRDVSEWGADLIGVANVEPLKELKTNPVDLLNPFKRAVSIAAQLPVAVFEMINDRPTPIYRSAYRTANRILDEIALKTSNKLQSDGYYSLPIPASNVVDWENWYGEISHKAVARMAGLGWLGKNLLLITNEYGPRVRLVTVLTDAPLEIDDPIKNRCGECTLCLDACPVGAIKGVSTEDHYISRSEALHLQKCAKKLTDEFAKLPGVGTAICGICIKVCPFGQKIGKEL
jgi:epoxyqueuosine reductase QueG